MRSPLWEFQKSLFTRLNDNLTESVYDFLPDPPVYPYVLMEEEESSDPETDKSATDHFVRAKLLAVSVSTGRDEIKSLVDSIIQNLDTKLTIADNWSVIDQTLLPQVKTKRVETFDGQQGHSAEIFYEFLITDTA